MRKLTILIIILQLGNSLFSQCYFQGHYGISADSYFSCFNKNSDNNFIVVGGWYESKYCWQDRYDNIGHFYIKEIDTCGILINETVIVNDTDYLIQYIEQTDTNSYFLLGSSARTCQDSAPIFCYLHVSSSGEITNSGTFNNYWGEHVDVIKLSNNNYLMVGGYSIIIVDVNGNVISSQVISGLYVEKIGKIPGENNYILIGNLTSPYDYKVIRLDDELNIVWEKTYSRSQFDHVQDINYLEDGNFVILGTETDTIINNRAYKKNFIQKMNSNGDSLWCKYYGGMDTLLLRSFMEVPETNDIISVGSLNPYDVSDGYFMRVDSLGNFINDEIFGGEYSDIFHDQWIENSSNIYLFGSTYDWETYNPGDVYIVKTNSDGYQGQYVSIPTISKPDETIVYPNPANKFITIESKTKIKSVSILSFQGKRIKSFTVESEKASIDISGLSSNIYILEIDFGDKIIRKKLIKE